MSELPNPLSALRAGAALVLSISGGKDSDAMTLTLLRQRSEENWPGEVCLVHADLGRAEHRITPQYVERFHRRVQALYGDVPLVIERHSKRDLLEGIKHRMATRPDAPPWPSAKNRWCTSDYKRAVISRFIRNRWPSNAVVISAMGLRAEESPARAKRPALAVRKDCTAPTKARFTYDWLPIHNWPLVNVWAEVGYSLDELDLLQYAYRKKRQAGDAAAVSRLEQQFGAHPAYLRGNQRLSCAMCVLASQNDILNGIEQDPDLYREYTRIEMRSGFSFRQGLWLLSLRPDLLEPDVKAWAETKGLLG